MISTNIAFYRMQLEMALHQLHTEERFNELLFWGKVTGKSLMFDNLHIFSSIWIGIKADYYIAMGLTYEGQFEFPNKKFYYYVSSDYTFKEMPDLNDQHKDFVNKESSYF